MEITNVEKILKLTRLAALLSSAVLPLVLRGVCPSPGSVTGSLTARTGEMRRSVPPLPAPLLSFPAPVRGSVYPLTTGVTATETAGTAVTRLTVPPWSVLPPSSPAPLSGAASTTVSSVTDMLTVGTELTRRIVFLRQ